jgi:osmoprotectant transport system ATP-binding protein
MASADASAGGDGGAAELVFDRVTKRYPGRDTPAVNSLSLVIPAGEICVLVGPSGGGKTTALKLVNRLIPLTSGYIRIDGRQIGDYDVTELRRSIGYVIQQVGLFPHMTVEANIGTVPRLLGRPRSWIRTRSAELLELVGLDPSYAKRFPAQLSGGERQRVGLARALAANPPLMLMDEPFGAIDPIVRARLQDEFLRLQSELRKTVVFVTHDIDEAVKLGDRIAILNVGGVVEQHDTPGQILGAPATPFVESFVGSDRALKRLKVTAIDPALLDHPPTLAPTDSLSHARKLLQETQAASLPVIDPDGSLRGRLRAQDAEGDGELGSRVVRVEAWVDVKDSLETALARSLLTEDGWIAVLDGACFLGTLTPSTVHRELRASLLHDS